MVSLDRPPGVDQCFSVSFLGRGNFRETYLFGDATRSGELDAFVLKSYLIHQNFSPSTASQSQVEALVMLQTSSSRHTTDAYGHCGLSILVEKGKPVTDLIRPSMHHRWKFQDVNDRKELHQQLAKEQINDVKPHNNLTPEQKLRMTLDMAEALAELHGNKEGVIAIHDLSFDQYLLGDDNVLKLNDFNKAVPLRWNIYTQQYCTFPGSRRTSVYLAPEQLVGGELDESSDTVKFGKILFTLLTGIEPYYEKASNEEARAAAAAGKLPYLDPRYRTRSFIEGRLVDAIEMCLRCGRTERASIFSVVEHLRETAQLVAKEHMK